MSWTALRNSWAEVFYKPFKGEGVRSGNMVSPINILHSTADRIQYHPIEKNDFALVKELNARHLTVEIQDIAPDKKRSEIWLMKSKMRRNSDHDKGKYTVS